MGDRMTLSIKGAFGLAALAVRAMFDHPTGDEAMPLR